MSSGTQTLTALSQTLSTAAQTATPQARVGIGVFILRSGNGSNPSQDSVPASSSDSAALNSSSYDPEFIIGRRLGSHGAGTWALPGGHLEFGESFETCAEREVLEETGLSICGTKFVTATNDIMVDAGRHYVTVFMVAERRQEDGEAEREPLLCEPEKCEAWRWIRWSVFVEWAEKEIKGLSRDESIEINGERLEGRLFSALRAIVQQRPDVVPRLPSD